MACQIKTQSLFNKFLIAFSLAGFAFTGELIELRFIFIKAADMLKHFIVEIFHRPIEIILGLYSTFILGGYIPLLRYPHG